MMHSAFAGWAGWRFASVHPFCRVAIFGGLKPTLQSDQASARRIPDIENTSTAANVVGWAGRRSASAHRPDWPKRTAARSALGRCPTLPAWRYAR
jgi:hypothetical protein